MERIARSVAEALAGGAADAAALERALAAAIAAARGHGGTIHVLEADGRTLRLAAWSANIPKPVLDAVQAVPIGKGMAGVAAERRAPVTTCDLQSDNAGGVARPGAKQTGFRGSICVPMISSAGALRGTLGIGCAETREFAEAEVDDLRAAAGLVADALAPSGNERR